MAESLKFFGSVPVIPLECAHFWHDPSAGWNRNVASFGDFTENTTPVVFTKLTELGMSVQTANSNLPGFRFTPSSVDAVYELSIWATMNQPGDGDNKVAILQLWNADAGVEITQSSPIYAPNGGIVLIGQQINAIFEPKTTNEIEIRIRGYSSSAGSGLTLGYVGHAVEWVIRRIK